MLPPASNTIAQSISSLDLLANAYGDSSDSDEEAIQHPKMPVFSNEHDLEGLPLVSIEDTEVPSFGRGCQTRVVGVLSHPSLIPGMGEEASTKISRVKDRCPQTIDCSSGTLLKNALSVRPWALASTSRKPMGTQRSLITSTFKDSAEVGRKKSDGSRRTCISNGAAAGKFIGTTQFSDIDSTLKKANTSIIQRSDNHSSSSRMHIFCLEHAVEIEKQLRSVGGMHMLLLCHPGKFWYILYMFILN